jgi:methyl-accepting chemotaxis protein
MMKVFPTLQRRLGRMPIGPKLTAAFGSVLLLTAVLGVAALGALGSVNNASGELADKWMPGVGRLASARSAILEFRENEVKHANATDASYLPDYEDKMAAARQAIDSNLAAYLALDGGTPDPALYEAFRKPWLEYLGVHDKLVALVHAGKREDARDISDGAAKMSLDDAVGALDQLSAAGFDAGRMAATRATAVFKQARVIVVALIALILLVGLVMAVVITRSLLRQLGGQPNTAAELARAVAEGDLTTPVHVQAGDTTSLMSCLHAMQLSLSQVVGAVRTNAEQVATASAQIAAGNQDLSGRTEQQASALQQTAATAEVLGSTVKTNAASARHANTLARSASEVAVKGGAEVLQVVDTMHGISDSARKISDIIGVIDGIAFQTNILALNAAVEAARAGEQGRGFAVVASEVRALAQRSAAAAKEIKTLISGSVQRMEQGSAIANQAGATMSEVVDAIRRVTDIVAEISAASANQSQGVAEVGKAVSQMDAATQRNAALVEESAAAANSLRDQSRRLVDAVAVFKTAPGQAVHS